MQLLKPLSPWWETIEGARFRLRPLTRGELMEAYAGIDLRGAYMIGRGIAQAAKAALLDWEGVTDDAGAPVPFSPAAFERLPLKTVSAIGQAALHGSDVEAEAEKNSASPSRSGEATPPSTAPDAPGDATATSGTPPP